MELKECLLKRRSVRKFKKDEVSEEIINELLHAGMSGPSACNKKPWEFYVISNKEKLEELKGITHFSKITAPLAIIVCGNKSKTLPLKFSEYWIQDCSAATENILLRVTDLGLGAVWCGIHLQNMSANKLKKLLDMPKSHEPLNIIFIGYADETPEPRDQYDDSCIHIIN